MPEANQKQNIRPITAWDVRKIDLAGDRSEDAKQLAVGGHTLKVVDASSPQAFAHVTPESKNYHPIELRFPGGWTHGPFKRLFINHPAQPGEWIKVAIIGHPAEADPARFAMLDRQNLQHGDKSLWVNQFSLDNTFGDAQQNQAGNVLWVPGATDATARVEVALNDSGNDKLPMYWGSVLRGIPFDEFYVTNPTSQSGKNLTLAVATEHPADPVFVA